MALADGNLAFGKAGGENDGGACAARAQFGNQRRYGIGRRGDDGKIRHPWHAADVGIGLEAVHRLRLRIDRNDRAFEAGL